MWAVWAHRRQTRLHIGLVGFRSDDLGVSFTDLYGFVTSVTKHINQRKTLSVTDKADVRRFDVKDTVVRSFQLESLILAQNERWRQA